MTTSLSILSHQIRVIDNLYCLNDIHKAAGNEPRHQPSKFLRLENTQEVIKELNSPDLASLPASKINSSDSRSLPVKTIEGRKGGTYACKELVYSYAMWISAKFHLHVIRAYDAMQTLTVTQSKKLEQASLNFDDLDPTVSDMIDKRCQQAAIEHAYIIRDSMRQDIKNYMRQYSVTPEGMADLFDKFQGAYKPKVFMSNEFISLRAIAQQLSHMINEFEQRIS